MDGMGFDEIDEVPLSMAVPFCLLIIFIGLFSYLVYSVDASVKRDNQEIFQDGLSYALSAYSTCYAKDIDNLSSISEGYIIDEDIIIYGQNNNTVELDYPKASNYFFNVLESNTPYDSAIVKTNGLFIVNITTSFEPAESYLVRIYRNGNDLMTQSSNLDNISEVEAFVEDKLDVNIDIANDFNISVRRAQRYASDKGYLNTSDGSTVGVYSGYTTNMCIAKDIPIRGIFGKELVDVHELQTYSLIRKE